MCGCFATLLPDLLCSHLHIAISKSGQASERSMRFVCTVDCMGDSARLSVNQTFGIIIYFDRANIVYKYYGFVCHAGIYSYLCFVTALGSVHMAALPC